MSDTLGVLDQYPFSIAHEERTYTVLALLVKAGRQSPEQLSQLGDLELSKVKSTLRQLYQANLVELHSEERYQLSSKGKVIGTRFGMTETAIKYLIRNSGLNASEEHFLLNCLEVQANSDESVLDTKLSLLRSVSALEHIGLLSPFSSRVRFAVVVGLDPNAHRLGSENYCDFILKQPYLAFQQKEYSSLIINHCKRALVDVRLSDRFLYANEIPSPADRDGVAAITLVRLFSLVIDDVTDSFLFSAKSNPKMPDFAWEWLSEWNPTLISKVWTALREQRPDLNLSERATNKVELLSGLLKRALEKLRGYLAPFFLEP